MESGSDTLWQTDGKQILLISDPTIMQELLEGEGLAVDALNDAVRAEARYPRLAVLHDHPNHCQPFALYNDDVVQTVGDSDGGYAVVGLEHKQTTEGVDDHGSILEQTGSKVGAAVDGSTMDVVEGEVAPE